MEMLIHKEYILEGLRCAVCADKIQRRIRKLDGVNDASIDIAAQKLSLELEDEMTRLYLPARMSSAWQ